MSDAYELATLIIVSIILLILVMVIVWKFMKHRGIHIADPTNHKFMSDPNLFRQPKSE